MSRKSNISYQERERLVYLTSQIRRDTRPSVKQRYLAEIDSMLNGKELTRSDLALAAFYTGNSGQSAEDVEVSASLAHAYRNTPAE